MNSPLETEYELERATLRPRMSMRASIKPL